MKNLRLFLMCILMHAQDGFAQTAVLVSGDVTTKNGRLAFKELPPGSSIATNPFDQFRGETVDKSTKTVLASDPQSTPIKAGQELDLSTSRFIETGAYGHVRLLFKDDSIVDLGPNTRFQVDQFEMNGKDRHIVLRLQEGKARVLVVRKLEGQSTYRLAIPGANVWVRGTDFVTHTTRAGDVIENHIIGVRGQVTVEFSRHTKKGEIYHQPIIVNTYSHLELTAAEGYVLSQSLHDHLNMATYSAALDAHAPGTDPVATPLGKKPQALAGAGKLYQLPKALTATEGSAFHTLSPYLYRAAAVDRLPTQVLRLASPNMIGYPLP